MVTFNYTEEFLRQAKRLAKRYHTLADDINAPILQQDAEVFSIIFNIPVPLLMRSTATYTFNLL